MRTVVWLVNIFNCLAFDWIGDWMTTWYDDMTPNVILLDVSVSIKNAQNTSADDYNNAVSRENIVLKHTMNQIKPEILYHI